MKAVKVVVVNDKKIDDVIELQPNAEQPITIDAVDHGNYILTEDGSSVAPENITAKRVGNDLYISLEGSDTDNPELIIRDYYLNEGEVVGKGEDGLYYSYVTSYGEPSAALPADTSAPLALGNDSIPGLGEGLVADESNPDLMWALAGLGLLALAGAGIAIANNNDDDGHHSSSTASDSGTNGGDDTNGGSGGDDTNGGSGGDDTDGGSGGDDTNGGGNADGTLNAGSLDSITDDKGSTTGPIAANGVTDDNQPTFNGSGATPGDTVLIKDANGETIGSTTANEDGSWSFTPDTPIADGEHSFSVVVVDPAGNESEPSNSIDVVIDTVAPGPTDLAATDDNGNAIADGGITTDPTPTFSGDNAEPGATVIISDGGKEIGTVTVDENGTWNYTPDTPLPDGDHDISVVVVDDAGNTSPATDLPITIDTTSPEASDVIATDESGNEIPAGGATNDSTPAFSGDNAEPGATVIISDGDKEIGTATVDENGDWNFTPDTPLDDGEHDINVVVVDDAGNTSPATDLPVIIDTVVPDSTANLNLYDDVGDYTGKINNGDTTDDNKPTYTGEAENGATVLVYDNGELIGSVTASSTDGTWAFTPTQGMSEGEHSLTSVVVDSAGNQSEPSASIDFTIDVPLISTSLDFETVPSHVFDSVGDNLTLDNGMTITFVDGPVDGVGNNSYTEISEKGVYWFAPKSFGEQALMLVEESTTRIDFNGLTDAVSFDVNASSFPGSVVKYFDASGEEIHQEALPVQTGDRDLATVTWTAPAGQEIAAISFETVSGVGDNVITRIDNIKLGADVTSTVSATYEANAEQHVVDTHDIALDYSAVVDAPQDMAAASQQHGIVAVQDHASLSVDQLLSEATTDLLVADGKQQVAITGEEGSHVTLQSDASQWQENGQVTAGGIHYDVYQQHDTSLELLVQQGVELQHG